MLGVALLAAITPIAYLPFLQESNVIPQLFFLVGLWAIRARKFWLVAVLVFAGTFAKETIIFIIPFFFLSGWRPGRRWRALTETGALAIIWGAAFIITRYGFCDGANSSLWQLPHNVSALARYFSINPIINPYIFYIPFFGALWIMAFIKQKQKPLFFQPVPAFVIIFMVAHFLFGWPQETRIILPLAFLVIPSSLMALFPKGE